MLYAIPRLHVLPPSSDFFWVQPKKVALFLRPKKAKKVCRFCTAAENWADFSGECHRVPFGKSRP